MIYKDSSLLYITTTGMAPSPCFPAGNRMILIITATLQPAISTTTEMWTLRYRYISAPMVLATREKQRSTTTPAMSLRELPPTRQNISIHSAVPWAMPMGMATLTWQLPVASLTARSMTSEGSSIMIMAASTLWLTGSRIYRWEPWTLNSAM